MEKYIDWEWYSEEIQAEEHSITEALVEWIGVHGALRIALKNPQMAGHPRRNAIRMIERIEVLLAGQGMTQTELDQLYWAETGGMTTFDAILEDEGDRARRRVGHLTERRMKPDARRFAGLTELRSHATVCVVSRVPPCDTTPEEEFK